jgi:hypothetical protein
MKHDIMMRRNMEFQKKQARLHAATIMTAFGEYPEEFSEIEPWIE